MKANELRLGNYVNFKNREDILFCSINELSSSGYIHLIRHFKVGDEDDQPEGIEDITPININEEWLERFGFVNTTHKLGNPAPNHKAFEKYNFHIKLYGKDIENYMWFGEQVLSYAPVQYVHQLQNLYFALTGEELTIKL